MSLPFDAPKSLALNTVRFKHLESSGIGEWAKGKRVLDVGCGVGHFARWFHERGADVTGLDARTDNLIEAGRREPLIRWVAYKMGQHGRNIDLPFPGAFDLVLCYGLLYHCANPLLLFQELRTLTSPRGFLLLESIVCDSIRSVALLRCEDPRYADQGLSGLSICPSPSFVTDGLAASGFNWVKWLSTDFRTESDRFDWKPANHGEITDEEGAALRAVFAASAAPLFFA